MFKIFLLICIIFNFSGLNSNYIKNKPLNQQIAACQIMNDHDKIESYSDGTYPTEKIEVELSSSAYIYATTTSAITGVHYTENGINWDSYSIDTSLYSNNPTNFIKFYNSIIINYNYIFKSMYRGNIKETSKNGNNINSKEIQLRLGNTNDLIILDIQEDEYYNSAKIFFKFSWHNSIMEVSLGSWAKTGKGQSSLYSHESSISTKSNYITLNSTFDWNTYYKNLAGGSSNKNNALGKGELNGIKDSYQYNAKAIEVIADEDPSWIAPVNMQIVETEVKKRIVGAFDNNELIVTYLQNFNNGTTSGLEVTAIPPDTTASVSPPKAKTQISFYNWQTKKNEKWTFTTDINFKLSDKYWNNNIKSRVKFSPGKVIAENGITVIDDVEEEIEKGEGKENAYNKGKIKYHTSVILSFAEYKESPNDRDYDGISVNGTKLNGYNGQYAMTLDNLPRSFDNQENQSEVEYKIKITHSPNPNLVGDTGGAYEISIIIENNMDQLSLTMMNWGEQNPDYEKLTSPTLKDPITGKDIDNPDYDPEINVNTGTREQIVWVKQESIVPFALDPISNDNYLITSNDINDYDIGFIAQASEVGGVGFSNYWNTDQFNKVKRYSSDNSLQTDVSSYFDVKKNENTVQTFPGIYHFTVESKVYPSLENGDGTTSQIPPFYMNKYILVKNAYGDFIDDINSENDAQVVTSFWGTDHGRHLRNYMIKYKGWEKATSSNFSQLSYEGVMAYWRNYVSDLRIGIASSEETPDNRVDLSNEDSDSNTGLAGFSQYVQTIKTGQDYNTNELLIKRLQEQVKQKIIDAYYTYDINNPEYDKDGNIIKNYVLKGAKNGEGQDFVIEYFDSNADIKTWKVLRGNSDLNWFITSEEQNEKEMQVRIRASDTSTLMKNISKEFTYYNNYSIIVSKLIDLNALKLKDTIGNFSRLSKTQIYENYITSYVRDELKILEEDKNIKITNADFMISTFGATGKGISLDDERLTSFERNIKEFPTQIQSLSITVYAQKSSLLIEGAKIYQLTHNNELDEVPEYPKTSNNTVSSNFWGKVLAWVIGVGLFLGAAILIMLWRWRWSRPKETYNTGAQRRSTRQAASFTKKKKDK